MIDEGKYTQFWVKYAGAIHVLLKKTDTQDQKLQLYKHEFEHHGHKQNVNITFSFDLINGKATNVLSTTTIARDLWQVLDRRPVTKLMLKERKIRISLAKSHELLFEKIADEADTELAEIISEENNTAEV